MKEEDLELLEDEIEDEDLEDEDSEEEEESDGYSGFSVARGFAAGLIVGALLGAGIALLVAPDRGETIRKRLGTGLRDLGDDARGQLRDWHGDARREVGKQRRRLQRRLRKVRRR
ncbi:MAG: hypothetical protein AMS18_00835 [Gemmatimonas sp. SG8_17]|nr:MAG: hypothetical protein AMS18_00835 [Gemmatimonas sp. SG8_17]